jgi:hypothetical protein
MPGHPSKTRSLDPDRRAPRGGPRPIPALLALALLALLGCGAGGDASAGDGARERAGGEADAAAGADTAGASAVGTPGRESYGSYGIRVSTDRAVYAPGDTIRMELEVFRRDGEPLTLHFSTAQRHDFLLRGPETATTPAVVWRWSDGRFFAQSTDTVTLGPGRPALTASVRHPAPGRPGRYRLEARVTASEWPLSATVPVTVAP